MSNRYPIKIENHLFVFDADGTPVNLREENHPPVAFAVAHQSLKTSDEDGAPTIPQLTIQFTSEHAINEFMTLMNGYLNTRWEEVPKIWRNVMDGIEHGVLIDHHVRHAPHPMQDSAEQTGDLQPNVDVGSEDA